MKTLVLALLFTTSLHAEKNSVVGNIIGTTGLPVAGATVYLEGGSGPAQVTVSDLLGAYAFVAVDDGDYQLKAWAGGACSSGESLHLAGEVLRLKNLKLLQKNTRTTLTLKLSPAHGAHENPAVLHFLVDARAQARDILDSVEILGALKGLEAGEYEVVMSKPGAAYVGSCLVLAFEGPEGRTKQVLQTSGMEIAGVDFLQALSEQATLSENDLQNL